MRVLHSLPRELRGDFFGACASRKKEKEEKRMKNMNKAREEAGDLFSACSSNSELPLT